MKFAESFSNPCNAVKVSDYWQFVTSAMRGRFYGFVCGHTELDSRVASEMKHFVGREDETVVEEYETQFAKMLGGGSAVAFAAGRMAFYEILKAAGVGAGDEVLLTGFTCSVMANAVWRTGATLIFADISPSTLGTCPRSVASKLSPRTRVIVAQHSFGIPCEIDAISVLAKQRGIMLLEDCALTVSSSLDGKAVGTWGDAAIFSTDHSKPLNTLTGGMMFTRNDSLAAKIRAGKLAAPSLNSEHQQRLWSRFQLESRWFTPTRYGKGRLLAKLDGAKRRLQARVTGNTVYTLLEADFKSRLKQGAYPYPAKFPTFLAVLGLSELERWPEQMKHRKAVLTELLAATPESAMPMIPAGYRDPRRDCVPLRLAFAHPGSKDIEARVRRELELDWFWFREPISFAPGGPSIFQYNVGDCPVAEATGAHIINYPCNVPQSDVQPLVQLYRKSLSA